MKIYYLHIFLALLLFSANESRAQNYSFQFCGETINLHSDSSLNASYTGPLSEKSVNEFYAQLNQANYKPVINQLLSYKKENQLNDWLYYQLIRRTVQQLSPKADNYLRYTLLKWFFMVKSGYDARLGTVNDKLLFYVRNNEDISDIPFFVIDGNKYMCLNTHDYTGIDFVRDQVFPLTIAAPEAKASFSYKVTNLPAFGSESYVEKDLQFNYRQRAYHFKVKLNPEIATIFTNYPGVDFESYFNIPLSHETYSSLIPVLRHNLKGMNSKKGVDYLMRFTRYAFLYEDDEENFGKEKRLSPEQTLFYDRSDCDDRAALFFYLVKEIYNLPMIALLYPTHITMAVQFDKPIGQPILYMGKRYSVCEPTPQLRDLKIGQLAPKYQNESYKVVYRYEP